VSSSQRMGRRLCGIRN